VFYRSVNRLWRKLPYGSEVGGSVQAGFGWKSYFADIRLLMRRRRCLIFSGTAIITKRPIAKNTQAICTSPSTIAIHIKHGTATIGVILVVHHRAEPHPGMSRKSLPIIKRYKVDATFRPSDKIMTQLRRSIKVAKPKKSTLRTYNVKYGKATLTSKRRLNKCQLFGVQSRRTNDRIFSASSHLQFNQLH
jgi:hypothetical protein